MNLLINENLLEKLKKVKPKTGYPSIDKTHEENISFLKKHPLIPSMSIYNALKLISTNYKSNNAVDCLDLRATITDLFSSADVLARGFLELGIKKGDIIAVSMPNYYQAIVSFLAANRIGATTTILNSQASVEENEYYLNLFESPLFINFNKDILYNKEIKKNTKIRHIITLEKELVYQKKFFNQDNGANGYQEFLSFHRDIGVIAQYQKHLPLPSLNDGKLDSLILFTSGTTGNPKSVVLTNKNVLASAIFLKNTANVSSVVGEKSLVCVPFCYPYGFATSTLMSLLCGREIILAPNISAETISYYFSKKPNIIFGSPALLELTMRNIPVSQDLSSAHTFISGGDFLNSTQRQMGIDFFQKHNSVIDISNGSGNAETVGAGTNAVGLPPRPETVGRILIGSDPIILDLDESRECQYGKEGTLCVRGQNVFKGYYQDPLLTEESKVTYGGHEYFKTGMRGFLEEDGFFTLTGRDSRFYIMSTLNKVYCDHVQKVIASISGIEACAVVPVPDNELLFVNKAYIVLKQEVPASNDVLNYIKEQCQQPILVSDTMEQIQLRPYEIPSYFEFIDFLPRTRADKVDYALLEEKARNVKNEKKVKQLTSVL